MRWGTVHTLVSMWLVRLHDHVLKRQRCCLCSGALDLSWVVFAGTNAFFQGGNFKAAAAAALSGAPNITGTATQVCRRQDLPNGQGLVHQRPTTEECAWSHRY